MSKECIKCGYVRQPTDTAPDYECPKCGVIYAKVEAALANGTFSLSRSRTKVVSNDIDTVPQKLDNEPATLLDSDEKDLELRLSDRHLDELPVPPFSKILGIIGSLVLFVGVFTPIVRIPIAGSMNYFRNGSGDGVIVIIMAILSLFFVFRGKPAKLFLTASGSLATLIITLLYFNWKMYKMKTEMEESLAGNPFRGLADLAQISIQIEWGWIVLVFGTGLLFLSAISNKLQIYSLSDLLNKVAPGPTGSGEESVTLRNSARVALNRNSRKSFSENGLIADELLKLNELRKAGAITDDEFDELKKKLLTYY